ncbi:MAG TPA: hypothetical protein PK176_16545 [Acidobacteriota bacterium]|nr:hypothetical protein [Acidobacteriota bacterium]HQM64922.1 hypothetical protein [Acidobacteriota bacterium]
MADHTIDDLMQREIDGANSAADTARLQEILSRDEAARARYEELAALAAALARVAPVPPPPGLKEDILAALPAGRYPTAARGWLWTAVPLRPAVQLGLALALGLALGFVASLLVTGGPSAEVGLDTVAGTLIEPSARGFRPVIEAEVALPALGGRARLSRSPTYLAVGLELAADAPATVRLAGAAGTLRSVGVVRTAGEVAARWTGDALVLEFAGPCRCVCFFAPVDGGAAGVRLSATAGDSEWTTILAAP